MIHQHQPTHDRRQSRGGTHSSKTWTRGMESPGSRRGLLGTATAHSTPCGKPKQTQARQQASLASHASHASEQHGAQCARGGGQAAGRGVARNLSEGPWGGAPDAAAGWRLAVTGEAMSQPPGGEASIDVVVRLRPLCGIETAPASFSTDDRHITVRDRPAQDAPPRGIHCEGATGRLFPAPTTHPIPTPCRVRTCACFVEAPHCLASLSLLALGQRGMAPALSPLHCVPVWPAVAAGPPGPLQPTPRG
jgi:hypothetical protein